jgi:hypothetical protein
MGHPRSWLLGNGRGREMFKTLMTITLLALLAFIQGAYSQTSPNNLTFATAIAQRQTDEVGDGVESQEKKDNDDEKCEDGLVLPVWLPQDDLSTGKEL